MPQSITIPASLDEAKEALTGLGELITARKWERAAIVAAFVRLDFPPGPRSDSSDRSHLTPREFAEFGIVGLSSHVSVTKYVQAWLDAHDGKYPRPGATRRLPNLDFPPMRTGTDGHNSGPGMQTTINRMVEEHGPEAVAQAVIETEPEAVGRAAARNPRASNAHRRTLIDDENERMEGSGAAQAGRGLHDVADRAASNYRRREYGTDDPDAQWAAGIARQVVQREIERGLRGVDHHADWIAALNALIVVASTARDNATGVATPWSASDRELLSELGIDTTGLVTR